MTATRMLLTRRQTRRLENRMRIKAIFLNRFSDMRFYNGGIILCISRTRVITLIVAKNQPLDIFYDVWQLLFFTN